LSGRGNSWRPIYRLCAAGFASPRIDSCDHCLPRGKADRKVGEAGKT
jgi:hypothetical protein